MKPSSSSTARGARFLDREDRRMGDGLVGDAETVQRRKASGGHTKNLFLRDKKPSSHSKPLVRPPLRSPTRGMSAVLTHVEKA
jgi:hypothetical protein